MRPIAEIGALNFEHSAGDTDEVPADEHTGVPHHHDVCHGHDLNVPLAFRADPGVTTRASPLFVPVAALHAVQTDTALRPPIA